MKGNVPCSYNVIGIKRFDIRRCNRSPINLGQTGRLIDCSQMSATHLEMTVVWQLDEAGKVDEQRRSFPNSQPRTAGLLAYRGITCER